MQAHDQVFPGAPERFYSLQNAEKFLKVILCNNNVMGSLGLLRVPLLYDSNRIDIALIMEAEIEVKVAYPDQYVH